MPTFPRTGGRARMRAVLPVNDAIRPMERTRALRAALGEVRDEAVLVIGSRSLEVTCDLIRRGARSVTLLRTDRRPEAASANLVVVPEAPSLEWLACVLGHARRALLPTGRLVLRVGALAGRQLAAQITRMLRVHGYTAIVARQAGDQLVLQAELPGLGSQMHA
jgi:hypothetical protein